MTTKKFPAQITAEECAAKTRPIINRDEDGVWIDEKYVFNDNTNEFLGLGYIDRSEPNNPILMVSTTGNGTDYEVEHGLFEPVINFSVIGRPADYFNVWAIG